MCSKHIKKNTLQCIILFFASLVSVACGLNGEELPPSRFDRTRPVAAQKSVEPVDPVKAAQEMKAREAARARGEVTFDDLKFDIEKDGEFKDELIADSIHEMEGKVVRLRGFILPSFLFQQKGFNRFVLVRDNQECCFGPGAALYDCVMIEMEPGKTADFTTRVVTVKGNFTTDTKSYRYPDGEPYAVFKITASEVK